MKQRQHFLQQALLGLPSDQASAKFGEHRGIETRIGEFQAKKIFPVDPPTDRICCLLIRQVLHKLQHSNQVHVQAIKGMVRLRTRRESALADLLALLKDPAYRVVQATIKVAWSLGTLGDKRLIRSLSC